jgi:hypothetical protein
MTKYRMTWAIVRVALLPFILLYALMWAQGHQPVRDDSAVMEVDVPTCTAPVQGTFPSGVILMRKGEFVEIHSDRLVGKALDQQFGNVDSDLQIIAFCK